jgi:peptide/nickel transport system substrate-binding protein
MVNSQARWVRALALGVIGALVLLACTTAGQATPAPGTSAPATSAPVATDAPESEAPESEAPESEAPESEAPESEAPSSEAPGSEAPGSEAPGSEAPASPGAGTPGGTVYILTQAEQWDHVDPQRIYTGEDLAFFGATIMRSLVSYITSTDPVEANSLQPDMATDTGTPNEDGTSWSFTLKDNLTWQDGSQLVCEDVAYGVSRTFAQDIITDGPTYALVYLDIPTNEDGTSQYPGPYTADADQQALFDEAVQCEGNTITFNLNQPVADFNYTTTLGFSPVPNPTDHPDVDLGEEYDTQVWSNGPYQIESYNTGVGGSMVLVRNPNYDPASDEGFRMAYPDRWEVQFGLDPAVIDQRLIASTGNDATALLYGNVQPENLQTLFVDPQTPQPDFEGRVVSDYDPYSLYYWINTQKVPNLQHRLAIAAALDREALRVNAGGDFAGDFADGVVKPNIGMDYAPTDFWGAAGPFGQDVPDTGDPALAQQLIADSGEEPPALTFDYAQTPVNDRSAAIVQSSLEAAGFTVEVNPIEPGAYYSTVLDPEQQNEFGTAGWGPDWPNASTVIPPLFTDNGGFNLSRVTEEDEPEWYASITDALGTLDRAEQATKWQALNKTAAENVWVVPNRFSITQVIAGNGLGNVNYQWAPYGSWPYQDIYVAQQ